MILLDTDHLSILLEERDARHPPLIARLRAAGDILTVPIAVVEEQLRAWLAKIRSENNVHRQMVPYLRLKRVFTFLREWPIADWNEPAADCFARMRKARIRIGTQDLKIACTAIANDALLLSANLRDFKQVPGLRVEDWLR
jgi:tRNA(fMet)-specific endonuclease VapC